MDKNVFVIFECVMNISEGNNPVIIESIADVALDSLLDVHIDGDHNRSVITLANTSLLDLVNAARDIFSLAYEKLSLENHHGVHPRIGTVDVCPFVSYNQNSSSPTPEIIKVSHEFGEWVNSTFGVPVFFYDQASPTHISLPYIRKHAFNELAPDIGNQSHRHHGAVCIGARDVLVALNINIDTDDLRLAQNIAREIRESSGGIKGVRAIGLELASKSQVQVSMNIIDPNVDIAQLCSLIRQLARGQNTFLELVGLMPRFIFDRLDSEFLLWSNLDENITIEKRLGSLQITTD